MKYSKLSSLLIILLTVFFTQCKSQKVIDSMVNKTEMITAAREIMLGAGYCALITQDDKGLSRVRTMDAFPPEDDFTVWLGTNSKSRKVEQIRKDSRVTLYYFDSKIFGYVTIYGTAELVNDSEMKKKKWKEAWEDFYPDKNNGYLLIKVTPKWMEVLSPHHNINNNPLTWEPPRVIFE